MLRVMNVACTVVLTGNKNHAQPGEQHVTAVQISTTVQHLSCLCMHSALAPCSGRSWGAPAAEQLIDGCCGT